MAADTAILILSHIINKGIQELHEGIVGSCSDEFDVFFVGDDTRGVFSRHYGDQAYFLFSLNDLAQLDYPGKKNITYSGKPPGHGHHQVKRNFVLGNTELPLLLFFRSHPGYRYYWIVEYDVRFSGSWLSFFSSFSDNESDLLATTLVNYTSVPSWPRWKSLQFPGGNDSLGDCVKGFFPIYRISKAALRQLDRDYKSGVSGHYECLMPTLLKRAGLTLEDMGGDGGYVKSQNINRFYQNTLLANSYAPGTFVYRPQMDKPGNKSNFLWHPVKYRPMWRILLSRAKKYLGL